MMRSSAWRPLLILGVACLLLAMLTVAWISLDSSLVLSALADPAIHHLSVMVHARALAVGGLSALVDVAQSPYEVWPPGTYLLYGVLGWLAGQGSDAIRMCGVLLLPLLAYGIYQLGRELCGPFTGCLAAVLCLFCFGVTGQIRHVAMDTTATVMTVFTMLALVRTRDYSRRGQVLLLGLVGGVGLLFRVQFLFFVVGPVLLVGLRSVRRQPGRRVLVDLVLPLAGGLVLFLLVSSFYWAPHGELLFHSAMDHWTFNQVEPVVPLAGVPRDQGLVAGAQKYLFYLARLAGWPLLIVALISAPLLLRRRPLRGATLLLTVWGLGGVGLMSITICDEPRYLTPALPALVLLAAMGIRRLAPRARALAASAVTIAVVLPTIYCSSPSWPGWLMGHKDLLMPGFMRPPEPDQMGTDKLLAGFRRVMTEDPQGERTLLIFDGVDIPSAAQLASAFAPRIPRALFGMINSPSDKLLCGAWFRSQLVSRRVLLLSVNKEHPYPKLALLKGRGETQVWVYPLSTAQAADLVPCGRLFP